MTTRHGHAAKSVKSSTYHCWRSMKGRCLHPAYAGYEYCGARGVKLHPPWEVFANFLADMGERPSLKHSIDRYPDRGGDYVPGNVRWATRAVDAPAASPGAVTLTAEEAERRFLAWAIERDLDEYVLARRPESLKAGAAMLLAAAGKGER